MEQQEEDNRYYIPHVADLRIGYEYWYNVEQEQWPDNWTEWTIEDVEDYTTAVRYLRERVLRAMYLTQQQIEELGYECSEYGTTYKFTKDNIHIIYNPEKEDKKLTIYRGTMPLWTHVLCSVECKPIKEIRYIMKLLKIQ